MPHQVSRKYLENIIYTILWVLILIIPIVSVALLDTTDGIRWSRIFLIWLRILPFFILFLVHNFLLAPILTRKRNYALYVTLCIVVTALIVSVWPFIMPQSMRRPPMNSEIGRMGPAPKDNGTMQRPDGMPRPGGMPPEMQQGRMQGANPETERKDGIQLNHPTLRRMIDPLDPNSVLLSFVLGIMLIGFNIAIKLTMKSIDDEHRMKDLENAKLQNELNYLKAQLNPHFFMNTLNNIHALVDIDSEKAKKAIIEFSKLMRFVLYEADRPTIDISKEAGFITNYVKLMEMRYTNEVEITFDAPAMLPSAEIPPLLFVSFLENAFKYGVRYNERSYIRISMEIVGGRLIYKVANSYWPPVQQPAGTTQLSPSGGIGIPNSIKRLDLLFGKNYFLDYGVKNNEYLVMLSIPISAKSNESSYDTSDNETNKLDLDKPL
jgi:hypothetical protein